MKKLISFVIPVLNEEANIRHLYKKLICVTNSLSKQYTFEFIFNDNCSSDNTVKILKNIKNEDNRLKINVFSKNVGYQNSIFYGYQKAKGKAVIQIDADMQDPPELIIQFIKKWEQNYQVVYGVRKFTKDKLFLKLFRKIFYRLLNFLSNDYLPLDAGDFRLIDRRIVNLITSIDDYSIYIRGYIASFGFKQIGIPYNRGERKKGVSKFRTKDLIKLALDGILNHTVIPLRVASIFGIVISFITLLLIIGYSFFKIFFNLNWPDGFSTLTVLILFSISLNAIFLGIIGEYIGRIFYQVKKFPRIIVDKTY